MRIILARHGDATNTDGKIHGADNAPLTTYGRRDTYELAKELEQYEPTLLFSSPVARARETSKILTSELKIPMRVNQALICWNVGNLVGKSIDKFGSTIKQYLEHPDQKVPGGESFNDFAARYLPFFEKYIKPKHKDTIIFLTHGRNILLSKAYLKAGGLAPQFDKHVLTDNKETTEHSGYAIATPPDKFEIVTPKAVASGRS